MANNKQTASNSQFSKLTRVMAAFTASLFLVSSQLALPAQANELARAARGDMNRQEWRQFRQEQRQLRIPERNDGAVTMPTMPGNPIVTPGFIPNPSELRPVLLGPPIRVDGRQQRREDRAERRENRQAARSENGNNRVQRVEARAQRVETRQAHVNTVRADRLSSFVIQENAGQIIRLDNGANLDLTASNADITIGDKLIADGGFVTIKVGDETKNVYAGSKVTAAEYVAVKQALAGNQTVVVNSNGIATGGTVDLGAIAATKNTMKATGLTVGAGVTATGDLDKNSNFRLNGDLNNFGSIYAVNTRGRGGSAEISAENITNNEGALISSNAGSLHGNQATSIDLSLSADNNFVNKGTVESSGDLSISAGNSISNGSGSQITANNNLNLSSKTIANAGTISSTTRDINLDAVGADMNVDNNGGTLQALQGAINVRAPNYNEVYNSTINGGDLLSRQVNMHTGLGTTDINVGRLTGEVTGSGTAAHVEAQTDNLVIGQNCLTGDPTYKNTGGDITFTGDVTVGEALAVLASGNILSSVNGVLNITARDGANNGRNIVMAAGFAVSAAGANTAAIAGNPPAGANALLTTVSDPGTGGSIDLTGGGLTTAVNINANALGAGDGGSVQMYGRFVPGNPLSGRVILPTTGTINTSGAGFGALNGNITVAAGNPNGFILQLPNLVANGGVTTVGGDISVRNAQPTTGGGVTVHPNGEIIVGGFSSGGTIIDAGVLIGNGLAGSAVNARNNILIEAGDGGAILNAQTVSTSGGNITVSSIGGNATLLNTTSVTTNGGNLLVSGTNARQLSAAPGTINTRLGLLGGGDVTFTASAGAASVNSAINSGVGNITLSGTTGAQVSGAMTTNNGDISLTTTGGNVLTQGNIVTAGGDLTLTATNGDVLAATAGTSINTSGGLGGDVAITSGTTRVISTLAITTGGGNVDILNGAVNVAGAINATQGTTGGYINIDTSLGNNNVNLTGNLTAGDPGVSLNAGTALITVPNNNVITGNGFNLDSTLVVGGGTGALTIAPLTDGVNIDVGSNVPLGISSAELALISAGTLNIGSATVVSDITITNNIDVSGVGIGNYNLVFRTAGNFDQNGNTITLGTRTLSIGTLVNPIGGDVQLFDINSTTGSVTVVAGGNSLGFVAGADITTTTGNVSLTSAGSIGTGIFDITSDSGSISLTANGGNILANNLATGGAGTITLFANGPASTIFTGDLTTNTGAIGVFSNESIETGDITTNGGILTLSTLTDITTGDISGIGNAAGLVLTVSGDIEVGNVTLTGAAQDIILTAGDDVNFGDLETQGLNRVISLIAGTVNSAGGDIGNNNSGNLTTNSGAITLSASDDIETGDIDTNGDTLTVMVTAPATRLDDVDLGDISGITNPLTILAGRDGGGITVGEVLLSGAAQNIVLDTNVAGGGSINTNGDLAATGAGAAISLLAGDSVDTNGNELTTTDGDITVTATTGDIDVEDVSTGFGNIFLTANNGAVEFEDIVSNAGGSLTVSAGDNIDMQNLTGTVALTGGNGSVSLTSLNGDVLLNDITVVGTGSITVDAGDFIFGNGFGADLSTDLGNVSLTAAGGVGVLDVTSNAGSILITANGANILAGDLSTGGLGVITLLANGDIVTDDLTTANGDITATSATGDVSILDINTTTGNINLTATQGSVEFEDVVSNAGGSLTVTAGDTIDMQSLPGTISLTGGNGSVSLTSLNGDVLLNDITVVGTGSITVDSGDFIFGNVFGADLSTDQGNVTLTAAGGVGVLNVDSNSGDISITANGANILVGDLTTGGLGVISLQADTDIDTDNLSTSSGNITATSANGDVTTGSIATSTGNITITADDDIDITGPVTGTTTDVVLNAGANIDVTSITLTGLGSDIFMQAGGTITTTGNLQADPISMLAVGQINLGGNVTADNGIVIVSGSHITSSVAGIAINGTSVAGNAGDITLIAGANFTNNGTSVTISGPSATGGDIDFNLGGGSLGAINSNSLALNGNGGDVTLAAFVSAGAFGRVLLTPGSSILTSGQGALGVSGDVNVVAATGAGVLAIQVGNVTTSSNANGLNGSGDVNLVNVIPAGGFAIDTNAAFGSVVGSLFGNLISNDDVIAGNIRAAGADVNVFSGRNAQLGTVNVSGNADTGADGGNIFIETNGTLAFNIGAPAGNGAVALLANGGSGGGNRNGGNIIVSEIAGQGIATTGSVLSAQGLGNGDGGLISLVTLGNISLGAGTVNANGSGTGDGGVIVLSGLNLVVPGGNAFLTANAGSGLGGLIDIEMTGTTSITIGSGAGQVGLSTSGLGSSINVTNSDNITVANTGSFSADFINLTATQNNVTINTGASVLAFTTLLLDASTNGAVTVDGTATGAQNAILTAFNNVGGNGLIVGANMVLTSSNGDVRGTGGTQLDINATDLTVNALGGAVNLLEVDSVNIAGASSSLADFAIQAAGDITSGLAGTMTSTAGNLFLTSNNGVVTLNANVTADDNVTLVSDGDMTNLAGTVVTSLTGNMSLTSDNGNIGTNNASRFNVSVPVGSLSANAPNGGVFIDAAGNVTLNDSTANGTLNIRAANDLLTLAGADLTANNIILRAVNGGIQFNAPTTLNAGNRISLRSSDTIALTNLAGTALVATNIDLTSDNGNIGATIMDPDQITVTATNVTANAAGLIHIHSTGSVNLVGDWTAGSIIGFQADTGNMTISGNLTATDILTQQPGGNLTISGLVNATNTVFLNTNGTQNTTGTGLVVADTVLLNTTYAGPPFASLGSTGSAGNRFMIDANNLVANSGASVFITDIAGGVNIGGLASGAIGNFDVIADGLGGFLSTTGTINANGNISLTSNLDSVSIGNALTALGDITITANIDVSSTAGGVINGDNVSITATTGGLALAGPITGVTSITLTAFDDITSTSVAALNTTTLNVTSTGGSIGTDTANRFNSSAANATFNAFDDVFVFNNGNLVLGPGKSSAGALSTFDVLVNGTLTVTGGIDPAVVVLNSSGDLSIASLITATVSISATSTAGSIIKTAAAGDLVAPQINLDANQAIFGTVGSGRLTIDADNLVANGGTNVLISDIDDVNVNGASSSAGGGVFDLLANGNLTSNNLGTITANGLGGDVVLRSTGGLVNLGADVTGDDVNVRGAGNVTNAAGTAVTGINAVIRSDNGNVGTSGASRFNVDLTGVLNVQANSAGANAFVQGLGDLILGTSSAGDTLNVHSDNNLTLAGASLLSGQVINLRATSGALDLNGSTLNGANRINLRSAGSIDTSAINGATLITPLANLTSDAGDIFLGPLDLNVASLTANAFVGDVDITTTNGVNIGPGSSSAGGFFQIVTGNNGLLSVTGTIDANAVVLDSDGAVSIQNTVTGTTSIEVQADASILNGDINGNLITNNLLLQSNFGSIGTAGQRVLVDTVNLTVIANGPGGAAFIRDTAGGLNLGGLFGASSTSGVLDVRSDNFLTTTATVSSSNNDVNLTSANNSITIGATVNADNSINLNADDDITTNAVLNADNDVNVAANGNININADVNASVASVGGINITSTGGNITTSNADADLTGDFVSIDAQAGAVSLGDNVDSTNGDITINGLLGVTTLVSSELTSSDNITVTSGLDINIGDSVDAGGAITMTASGNLSSGTDGDIDGDSVTLTATNGSVTLNNQVQSDAGDILITAGTNVVTNAGADLDGDDNVIVVANGDVNIGDDVNAGNDILLDGANVTTSGIADLDAGNDVFVISAGAILLGDTVNAGRDIDLLAGSDIITALGATLDAGRNVNSLAGDDILFGDTVTAAQDVNAEADNILSTAGSLIFGTNVNLRAVTGAFDLDGGVGATQTANLRSNLGITNANLSGGVGAPQVNLTSDTGDIGTNTANRLSLDLQSASFNATLGNVFFFDNAGTLNIGGASSFAPGVFDVLAVGDTTTDNTILATNVVLRSTGGSLTVGAGVGPQITGVNLVDLRAANNLSIDGEVTAVVGTRIVNLRADNGILVLNADVSGDVLTLRSGSNMTSPVGTAIGDTSVSLTSDNGNIGVDALNPFVVNTLSTTINAPNGSAWVRNNSVAATVNLQQSNADGTLSFVGINNVNVAGQLTGNDINVQSEQAFFFINGNVIADSSVTLQSRFDITDLLFANQSVIQAPITTLISDLGNIGAFGNTLDLDLNTVNFDAANGSVYFFDPTNLTIGGAATLVLGDVDVTANGALNTTGAINAGNVFLTSLNSSLDVGANINAAFAADLESRNNLTTSGGAVVSAFDTTLTSNFGNIGSAGTPFAVEANNLTANAPQGDVFIDANQTSLSAINLVGASSAFGLFSLSGGGNVTSDLLSSVNALNIDLFAGGSFILGGTFTAGNTINATSNGSILAAGVGPTTFSATILNLTSVTGDIGLNAGNRLVIDADNLTANAANGNVFIDGGAGALNLGLGNSQALLTFDVVAGTLSTTGDVEGFDVSLVSTVGGITIDGDVDGDNSVNLNSATTLTQNSGTIFGGDLTLTYTVGNTALVTAVDTLTTNAAGSNLTVNNGGTLTLLGQSVNNLTINNIGSINTGVDVTVTGDLSLNTFFLGSINLNDDITAGGNVILHANGAGGTINQGGGQTINGQLLDLAWDSNNVTLVSAVTGLTADSPGNNLTLTNTGDIAVGFIDLNALTLIVNSDITVNSPINLADVLLQANTGDIILNANVTGTNTVTLRAFDTITQNSGTIFGGALTLSYNNGPVTLNTDVNSVSAVAVTVAGPITFDPSLTALTINDAGDINVNTTFVDSLTVNAFGDININGNVDAATLASFSAGFGDITQVGGVELRTDDLRLDGDGTISILDTFSFTNTQEITVTGGAVANVTTGEFGTVILNASSATSLFLDASGSTEVTTAGNTTVSDFLDITTPRLNNQFALSAGDILSVQSPTGDLTINGGAGAGSLTSSVSIDLTATSGDLIFLGNQNFFGVANLFSNPNPPFGSIVIDASANVVGDSAVNLNTCSLILDGTLIGNPINYLCPTGGGTIANSNGNVNLASNINFVGLNLAILASGSINGNGFNIDLSDGAGGSGSLTMLAGFNFTPATGGQLDFTPILFTLNGPNVVTGGNINMGSSTITLNGGAGNGGNVFAAAVDGGVFNGDVTLGTVNLNGSAGGGNLLVLAGGNINANGSIDTNGGDVDLQVTNPQQVGIVYVANGDVFGGGAIVGSGLGADGNININNNINVGTGSVNVLGAAGGADQIFQSGGTVTADTLNIEAGTGPVTFNSTSVNFLNSDALGSVFVSNTQNLGFIQLSSITGATQDFQLSNFGGVLSNGTININSLVINEFSNNGIVINGSTTTVADISIENNGGGDVTIQAAGSLTTTGGGDINVDADNNVSVVAGATINSSSEVDLLAFNNTTIDGTVQGVDDVYLFAGNNLFVNNTVTSTSANVILEANNNIDATALLSAGNDVGVFANNNVDVDLINAGNTVDIFANNGYISINNTVTATNSVFLETGVEDIFVDGAITTTNGVVAIISAEDLDVNNTINAGDSIDMFAEFNVRINDSIQATNNVIALANQGDILVDGSVTTTNGFVDLAADDNIFTTAQINAGDYADLFTNNGDVDLGADVFAVNGASVDAGNNIVISANVTIDGGSTVDLFGSSVTGANSLALLADDSISVNTNVMIGGDFSAATSNLGSLVSVQGVDAGGDILLLSDNVFANGTLVSGNDTIINSGNGFATQADITATGDVFIVTNDLSNTNTITGDEIFVTSFAGFGLNINGGAGGTFTSTGNNIELATGTTGDVTFTGVTTFNGDTFITPGGPGFGVVVANGAVVTGNDNVTLNTCLLILQGNGTITGDLLHFNCPNGAGTIANNNGDIDLTGMNLSFDGLSLAIIASGDVFSTGGTTLNLSSTTADGGDLTIVAGFAFGPDTFGTVGPNDTVYTFTGLTSPTGGDIDLVGVNITTNGAVDGNGGDITLVAAAGTPNSGSINVGNLTADGAGLGNGGDILVIAEGGFFTGTLSTNGVVQGSQTLAAATPQIVNGPLVIGNGEILNGQFTFGAVTGSGTIANMVGDVELGNLNLTFVGENLAIIASGNITATGTTNTIDLSNPGGAGGNLLMVAGFDFAPGTGGTQVNFNSFTTYTFGAPSATGGDILLGNGFAITTNGNTGDAGNVTLVAKGGGNNDGFIDVGALNLIGTGGGNGGDLLVIAEGGFSIGSFNTTGAVNGSQTLAAAAPTITGGNITVLDGTQGGPGQFTFTAPTGSGTIANSQGAVNLSGTIGFTGASLAVIALTDINAAAGTVLNVSDAGGIGGDVTMIAGYDFDPDTVGQVTDNLNTFTNFVATAAGGSINGANITITTTGLTAGGNVIAVANGGTGSNGSVTLGNIATGSTNTAGDVLIIGEGGITTGSIIATGATGGDVSLLVAQPVLTGVQIQNGNLLAGTFAGTTFTNGLVNATSIDAGNNVVITANTGAGAGITVGNIQADNDINITNTGSITINDDLLSDDGAINILANDVAGQATLLTINTGVSITADTQIDIVNTGTDKKLDKFNIGANAIIATTNKAALGDINLRLGAVSPQLNNNKLPKSRFTVVETGGVLTLFGGKPRGSKPVSTLTMLGANLNITNTLKGKAFNFLGGVQVTADPPVASGTPTYVNGRLVGGSERAARTGSDVASNAIEGLTAALDSTLISGNAFDHAQTNNMLSTSTVIGTETVGTSLTAGTTIGTNNTATRTETLVGGVSQVAQGEDNSYMVSSHTGPVKEAEASICTDADLGTTGNAAHIAHNDRVVLKQGNVLFVPFRNTVVETPQGNVVIEAKSVALVSVSNDKLAVYDIEDSHKGAVSIEAHGQKVALAPGSHLTVASAKSGEFAQVNAIEAIPHRNVATKVINNGAKLHTSEFSVVSALQTVKPLQAVMNSKHPQAKKVADRLMKTTAVILSLGGKGEFQHFFKPALTAMK